MKVPHVTEWEQRDSCLLELLRKKEETLREGISILQHSQMKAYVSPDIEPTSDIKLNHLND